MKNYSCYYHFADLNHNKYTEIQSCPKPWRISNGLPQSKLRISGSRTNPRRINLPSFSNSILKHLLPIYSIIIILYQNPLKKSLKRRRDLRKLRNNHLLILEHLYQLRNRFTLEWALPKQHLIKNHTNWPNICLDCIDFSFNNLWSHIDRWTKHSLCKFIRILQWLTESKICDFDTAIMKKDVIGFNISMHNITPW